MTLPSGLYACVVHPTNPALKMWRLAGTGTSTPIPPPVTGAVTMVGRGLMSVTGTPFAPGSRWDETQLSATQFVRPREVDAPTVYRDWENIVGSTVAAAQAAAPNTPTPLTKAVVDAVTGSRILSLPKGIFTFRVDPTNSGYPSRYSYAIGVGTGFSTGCRGFVGAGCLTTPGPGGAITTIKMAGPTTESTGTTSIRIEGIPNSYLGGIHFAGTQTRGDGIYGGGITVHGCRDGRLEYCSFRGWAPGYANIPPGETFGVNVFSSPDYSIYRCSADGRDAAGARTSASPFGWNSCGYVNGLRNPATDNTPDHILVQETYVHHGLTSMLTFWEVFNVRTVDFKCYSWAWGTSDAFFSVDSAAAAAAGQTQTTSRYRGSGLNHEECGGKIRHTRPTIYLCSSKTSAPVGDKTQNQGNIMSFASVMSDIGADAIIDDILFDQAFNSTSGMLAVSWNKGATYPADFPNNGWAYMITVPRWIYKGVSLTASIQKLVEGGASISGFNNKDPNLYWAAITG